MQQSASYDSFCINADYRSRLQQQQCLNSCPTKRQPSVAVAVVQQCHDCCCCIYALEMLVKSSTSSNSSSSDAPKYAASVEGNVLCVFFSLLLFICCFSCVVYKWNYIFLRLQQKFLVELSATTFISLWTIKVVFILHAWKSIANQIDVWPFCVQTYETDESLNLLKKYLWELGIFTIHKTIP